MSEQEGQRYEGNAEIKIALVAQPSPTERGSGERKQAASAGDDWQRTHSRRQLWFNGALVFFTALLVGASIAQWCAINRQASITEDQIRVSGRPWVSLDVTVAGDLIFEPNGSANILVRYNLKNAGHSPAVEVQTRLLLFHKTPARKDLGTERRKLCDQARTDSSDPEKRKDVMLFQDGESASFEVLSMSADEIRAAASDVGPQSKFTLFPVLVACVVYKFSFEDGWHSTSFARDVTRFDPSSPNFGPVFLFEVGKNEPHENISIGGFGHPTFAD